MASPPLRDGAIVLGDGGAVDGVDGVDGVDAVDGGATDGVARRRVDHRRGGVILAVGTRADLKRAHPGLPETRAEGALCPALVNAHAHLELSSLMGLVAGGDGVVNWTRRLAARAAAAAAPAPAPAAHVAGDDAVLAAAVLAAREAKRLGTVAVADVGNGTSGWRALGQAGLQGTFFHELVGSREARTGDALADAAAERARVPRFDRPRGVAAVPAPHAPYSVGPALMRRIFAAAAAAGHPTTIHLAEDTDEIQLLRDGTGPWATVLASLGADPRERSPGVGPTAYLDSLGAFATAHPPLLVHMVHADADDRRRARAADATVVLCPRSNLHIGGRLPDVPALLDAGVRLAIGTDSLASAPDLSLWEEMATLAQAFPDVPPRDWLIAASAGGAAALDLPQLGSLAVGQRPGVLDVELPDLASDPERGLVSQRAPIVRWMAAA